MGLYTAVSSPTAQEDLEGTAKQPVEFPSQIPAHNAYQPEKPLIATPSAASLEASSKAKEGVAEGSRGPLEAEAVKLDAQQSFWHWKRPFTPAFTLDTGVGFDVRGQNTEFDSCLRQQDSPVWESQQQQIRQAVGLQVFISPSCSLSLYTPLSALCHHRMIALLDDHLAQSQNPIHEFYPLCLSVAVLACSNLRVWQLELQYWRSVGVSERLIHKPLLTALASL